MSVCRETLMYECMFCSIVWDGRPCSFLRWQHGIANPSDARVGECGDMKTPSIDLVAVYPKRLPKVRMEPVHLLRDFSSSYLLFRRKIFECVVGEELFKLFCKDINNVITRCKIFECVMKEKPYSLTERRYEDGAIQVQGLRTCREREAIRPC